MNIIRELKTNKFQPVKMNDKLIPLSFAVEVVMKRARSISILDKIYALDPKMLDEVESLTGDMEKMLKEFPNLKENK